jgi:hypothetical protein
MPDLHVLGLHIEWDKATPVGLQQLPSLKKIEVCAVGGREKELVRGVFQEAVHALPSRPTLNVASWLHR